MKTVKIKLSTGEQEIRYGRNTNPAVLENIASDKSNRTLRNAVAALALRDNEDTKDGKGVYPRDRKFFTFVAESIARHNRLPANKRDEVLVRTLRYGRQLTEIFTPKPEDKPTGEAATVQSELPVQN